MRLLQCGDRAVLLDCADLDEARRWHAVLQDHVPEAVLGARTVLLRGEPAHLRRVVHGTDLDADTRDAAGSPVEEVVLEVAYDGEDLAEVARLTGMGVEEVVAAHTGTAWTVAFGGFAPGFAYLVGGDERLVVPRRGTPRSRVPSGAVGLAGEFSGVYPRESPGGWQLIGRTDATLFDVDRSPAALLRPGLRVRFTPAEREVLTPATGRSPRDARVPGSGGLLVVQPGPLTLVQDRGRPGLSGQGVGPSGAFDRRALAQLHDLLGSPATAAALEVLGGGLVLRAEQDVRVAVTGAVGPLHVDARPVGHGRALSLTAGASLHVGPLEVGLRTYVGAAGGLAVEPVLGSRSSDLLSGLGPRPVAAGDRLALGPPGPARHRDPVPALLTPGSTTVDVVVGPRDDWFTSEALATLLRTGWTVSARSDRIGVRLDGPTLHRRTDGELPSEPCVAGSVQVTSDGQPVVLGPDHPVTGGYPVPVVVVAAHLGRLAQVRPGEVVRFRRTQR